MTRLSRLITYILVANLLALLAGCAQLAPRTPDWKKDRIYHLTVLHTNDNRGHFWKNSQGEYGMAARKTLIDDVREEVTLNDGHVLLLSGGDINTGVAQSDIQNAEPDFRGMQLIGYDAMAVGDHEFDHPLAVIRQQQKWAGFPFLSANIFDKKTGEPLFDAYKIFQEGDLKVAVVGFTTVDAIKQSNPENLMDIEVKSPIEVAKTLIPELRQKADIIIALTHMGHYDGGNYGSNAPGDVTLAKEVPGIDIIIGGHSQEALFKPDVQNGTLILQAKEWGKYVGRLDLSITNGKIASYHYKLMPVNLRSKDAAEKAPHSLLDDQIPEDPEMLKLLAPFEEKGKQELSANADKNKG